MVLGELARRERGEVRRALGDRPLLLLAQREGDGAEGVALQQLGMVELLGDLQAITLERVGIVDGKLEARVKVRVGAFDRLGRQRDRPRPPLAAGRCSVKRMMISSDASSASGSTLR